MLDRAQYDRFRLSPDDPAALRARDVETALQKLAKSSAGRLRVEKFDESLESRPVYLATLGTGPKRVLMWSQMHGDEPTLTAVLLDLFSYLLRTPAEPLAEDILKNCTLLAIPMLNPDGAERQIRFNAQGIDINRDWRRLATPEGRALLRAAKMLQPQYGFNLHNQNARTSVGRPPLPAAVSVLAPAPDASRNVSPSMLTAKRMCTCFVEAVRPFAQNMISRYDDSYEPRAFGDGIQSLGIATMLVEAGGWPTSDPEPMTRLHFHGLLSTLHAIATDKHLSADPKVYEDLPESNSARLNDCFISKGRVFDAKVTEPFAADLLIDQTHSNRLLSTNSRDGRIVDIGDIPPAPARLTLSANGMLILPGQIALVDGWKTGQGLDDSALDKLLAQGVTTAVARVHLSDREAIDAMASPLSMPINWVFVGDADNLGPVQGAELLERLAVAAAHGMLAVVSSGADETLWRYAHEFGLPLVKHGSLAVATGTYADAVRQCWSTASLLKLQARRGRINRDFFADLLFFAAPPDTRSAQAIDWTKLERVLVAGETVWDRGKRAAVNCGAHLRRSAI